MYSVDLVLGQKQMYTQTVHLFLTQNQMYIAHLVLAVKKLVLLKNRNRWEGGRVTKGGGIILWG